MLVIGIVVTTYVILLLIAVIIFSITISTRQCIKQNIRISETE